MTYSLIFREAKTLQTTAQKYVCKKNNVNP